MEPKLLNATPYSPLHFIPAAGCFLNLLVQPLLAADEHSRDHTTYIIGVIPFVIVLSMHTLSDVVRDMPLPHPNFPKPFPVELPGGENQGYSNIRVYIYTAAVVVISYVSLLVINEGFIVLALFPLGALAFIFALWRELRGDNCGKAAAGGATKMKSTSVPTTSDEGKTMEEEVSFKETTEGGRALAQLARHTVVQPADSGSISGGASSSRSPSKTTEEEEQLKAIPLVPYWVLCAMRYFRAENLAVSQFLLFLSTTLGALMLMLMRLPGHGGVAQASEVLRKASLVVLLVTVHAMAAELLGEDVVLFCTPEFVPALIWFSIHLDGGSPIITVDKIMSHKKGLIVLGAAAAAGFAYLAGAMDESGLSICGRASVSSGVSGVLAYYVEFMLRQWPAQGTAIVTTVSYFQEGVKMLEFWAKVLLLAAAAFLVSTVLAAVRLGCTNKLLLQCVNFWKSIT